MGASFKIVHSLQAAGSPARPLIYEGVSELAQEGNLPDSGLPFPVSAGDTVLFAVSSDDDIVGVLCYVKTGRDVHVTLAYVEPSSRRMGVMRTLWETLAQDEPGHSVSLPVALSNEVGRQVLHNLGLHTVAETWSMDFPKKKSA